MRTIIGIDPGKNGAIVALDSDRNVTLKEVTPTISKEIDWNKYADILRRPDIYVFLEQVHAMYGSSAAATFTFGGCFHGVKAILAALKIPHTLVQPKAWQKIMYQGVLEIRKPSYIIKDGKFKGQTRKGRIDTKAMSLIAAKRLFPLVDLRKSERCKVPHDGIVDALLICEYGRRLLGK